MNMIENNVMAENAMTPSPATQVITANQPAISPRLQKWIDFCEQTANEVGPVEDNNYMAQFIKDAEDLKKARAEKRLRTKLKKMEIEQKALLLAEAQNSLKKARRHFEAQPQVPYDFTSGPPTSINDLFREEKARNELKALEREQKEALYNEVMEKRAKEAGEQWPPAEEMVADVRFDHIPKYWPGEKEIIAKAFQGSSPIESQESNEHPAAS